jgi:ketosteroid isomerase-like protein
MSDSPEMVVIHRAWQALTERDLQAFRQAFAPSAKWLAVDDPASDCENRDVILEVMERNLEAGLAGQIEETTQQGSRVLVGYRPEKVPDGTRRPLDHGIAYVVVTVRDGEIVEMKGCADRAGAMSYMGTG